MTCDPNNISRLSSCHRCLTDAQLMIVRTYLLCQWANKVGVSTPGAPTNPDINLGSASDNIIFMWANGSPVGTTNEIWKSTDGVTFNLFATVAGGIIQKVDNTVMGVGDIWYYKVRSCNGASCSAFTSVVSVSNEYTSPNVAAINFPTLIMAFKFFDAFNLAALTSVSMPKLKSVTGNLNLSLNANLTTLTLTALENVSGSLFLGLSNPNPISLPALTNVGADFQAQGNTAATSLSAPLLTNVGSNLLFSTCTAMTSFNLASLQFVGVDQSVGRLDFNGCSALLAASFPALVQVWDEMDFNNCNVLASIQLASLQDIHVGAITGNTCPLLVTWNAPNWVLGDNGQIVRWTACGLNATSVNQILARGVASAVTTVDFELAAGTNAAPSGQGVADKATLIGAGNTVNTN